MKNVLGVLVFTLFLACSVSVAFAATEAEDTATMTAKLAKVEDGSLTVEQALASAIEQGVSYEVIVQVCEAQQIPLSVVISAAKIAGQTPAAAVAKLADAGVDKVKLSDALTTAVGEQEATLVYSALESSEDVSADQQGEPEAGASQGAAPEGQVAQSTPETQNAEAAPESQSQASPGQNLATTQVTQSQQEPALAYTPAPAAAPAVIAVVPVTTNPNPTQPSTVSPSK